MKNDLINNYGVIPEEADKLVMKEKKETLKFKELVKKAKSELKKRFQKKD
ncbi:MAG TPA: hypothetical protein PLA71_00095 [Saccharofermentans sp.]|nr:hypothetical protein [Saccharofermentans sp.]